MKKIQFKVLKTFFLAILIGGVININFASAAPAKSHSRPAAASHATRTHVASSHSSAERDHRGTSVAASRRPEHHDDHVFRDSGHADVHYTHNSGGWDGDHHRREIITYRGERGYWDYRNGQAVFISIGLPGIQIHI